MYACITCLLCHTPVHQHGARLHWPISMELAFTGPSAWSSPSLVHQHGARLHWSISMKLAFTDPSAWSSPSRADSCGTHYATDRSVLNSLSMDHRCGTCYVTGISAWKVTGPIGIEFAVTCPLEWNSLRHWPISMKLAVTGAMVVELGMSLASQHGTRYVTGISV